MERALLAERNLNNLRTEKEYIRRFIVEELKHFQKTTHVLDVGNGTRGRSLQRPWRNPLWDQIPKEEVVCGCHGGGIQVQHRTWTRCHLSGTRTLGQNPYIRPPPSWSNMFSIRSHPNFSWGSLHGHSRHFFDSILPPKQGTSGQDLVLHLVVPSMVTCYPGLPGGRS